MVMYGTGPIGNMSLVDQARTEQAAGQSTTAPEALWPPPCGVVTVTGSVGNLN